MEFATKQVQDLYLVIGEGGRDISKTDALCSLSNKQDPKSPNFREELTAWGTPPRLPLGFTDTSAGAFSPPGCQPPPPFSGSLGLPGSGSALGGGLSALCPAAGLTIGRRKRGPAPPACTCASPGRRERLRRGVQQEGEREARQNLGPGRPGRPRRSCSLQQEAVRLWYALHSAH